MCPGAGPVPGPGTVIDPDDSDLGAATGALRPGHGQGEPLLCKGQDFATTALHNKLDRVETGVSAALGRDSAALAEPVVKALRASHPRWLPG